MVKDALSKKNRTPVIAYNENTKNVLFFCSIAEAGKQGFHKPSIIKCCKGRHNTHKDYVWRYAFNGRMCKLRELEIKKFIINNPARNPKKMFHSRDYYLFLASRSKKDYTIAEVTKYLRQLRNKT